MFNVLLLTYVKQLQHASHRQMVPSFTRHTGNTQVVSPADMCHHTHTPVSLPPWSHHSPAWPVVRPHSPSPSQPGPKDLRPRVPSSCGPSCARPCSRHGRSIPGHRAAQVPALGTLPTVLKSWDLPGSLAEPSSRHGPSSSTATPAAGALAGTRAIPSHDKDSSTAWAVGEITHLSWKSIS